MKRIAQALAGTALGLFGVIGTAAAQMPGYTLPGAALFAGPGEDYPYITDVPPGQQTTIFGCEGGYGWCDVAVDGTRGWVPGDRLQVEYGNQWGGLSYYGPRIGLPIIGFDLGSYWGSYYRGRPFFADRDRFFGYGRPGWSRPGNWGRPGGWGGPGPGGWHPGGWPGQPGGWHPPQGGWHPGGDPHGGWPNGGGVRPGFNGGGEQHHPDQGGDRPGQNGGGEQHHPDQGGDRPGQNGGGEQHHPDHGGDRPGQNGGGEQHHPDQNGGGRPDHGGHDHPPQ